MWKRWIVFPGALAWLAGFGFTVQQKGIVAGEEVIASRQESMDMSAIAMHSMRAAMDAGSEAKAEAYPAAALAKWARTLPGMFPAGTAEGETSADTQALGAIWRDRSGFERAAADYADATAKLADLARANDTVGFTKQLDAVKRACDSCHARYKAGPQGPPPK